MPHAKRNPFRFRRKPYDVYRRIYWKERTTNTRPKSNSQTINILKVSSSSFCPLQDQFMGACIDTGATTSVCGLKQAHAYCRSINRPLRLHSSSRRFRFGNGCQNSKGTFEVRIPTPIGSVIRHQVDVVGADIPLLLGLDLMTEHGFVLDLGRSEVRNDSQGWTVDLQRKIRHLFLTWDTTEILFTKMELEKLHLQFFHPTAKKLFNLVRRARPAEVDDKTLKLLENISKACATCVTHSARGLRFKVSMPDENITFNQSLSMDFMIIDGRPVLHVVDTATGFGNCEFVEGGSVEEVWATFLKIWVTLYPGYPNRLRIDQAGVFTSPRWQKLADMAGISLQLSGVESHNSIGLGERYHAPLRRICNKIREDAPSVDPGLALRLS